MRSLSDSALLRPLSESALMRYILFGALYFAQGLPWGFISVGYVVFLSDQGLSSEAIGWAVGMGYIPWSFKIVFGPLVDKYPSLRFGRRRHFIILSELMMGLSLLALVLLDPRKDLTLLAVVLFINNTFAALQDVAVDALAVDVLPESERGKANSIMWAGKSAGVAVGGGAGTILAKYTGWPTLFVLMAVALWLILLLPLLVKETPDSDQKTVHAVQRVPWRMLWDSFAFKAPLVGLAVSFLTPMGYALTSTPGTHLMRSELKLSEEVIGTLAGVVDPVSGVIGALVGGALADRIGMRRGIAVCMFGIALALGAFAALPSQWPAYSFLVSWTVVSCFFINAYNASSLGYFMSLSNPLVGATQFTLFMAGTNLCYSVASPLGGYLADRFGYQACFGIAALVQVLTISVIFLADHRTAAARYQALRPSPEILM